MAHNDAAAFGASDAHAHLGSSTAAGLGAGTNGGSAFFEGERDRLLNEIAISLEVILSNSNVLNRKLEESIAVGREFEPIAQLWGRFSSVMQAAGIPEYTGVGLGPSTGEAAGQGAAGLVFGEGEGELGHAGIQKFKLFRCSKYQTVRTGKPTLTR
ncbi:unnamed protein product [Tilletia controversa]|nr:unnamed protein product [Tilletia controversa]